MKKYPSITNQNTMDGDLRSKFFDHFLLEFPALNDELYIIQEKIHGTNIRIHLTKDKTEVGSRNHILGADKDNHGSIEIVNKMSPKLDQFRDMLVDSNESITLFGELFGPTIQKGVDYGKEKRILFFDMAINDQLIPPAQFLILCPEDLRVPVLGYARNLKEALSFKHEFISNLSPSNSIAEGIVIKPNNTVYWSGDDLFYIKHKSSRFLEHSKAAKVPKEKEPLGLNPLIPYLNQNRVDSVYSKEGEITDKKEIGRYIQLVLKDICDDYEKDTGLIAEGKYAKPLQGKIAQYLLKAF